jgi:hypothetical protein
VVEARAKEMEYVHKMRVYDKVDRETADWESGGKRPIRLRWVDTNKGSPGQPNVRSRLVAMEFKVDKRPDLFSATPPIEAVRMLVAMMAGASNGTPSADPMCMMHVDVSRAYFHAPSKRTTIIELPEEDKEGSLVGRLRMSMYGTRDAQQNWEETYVKVLIDIGFKRGVGSPCAFVHRGLASDLWCMEMTSCASEGTGNFYG